MIARRAPVSYAGSPRGAALEPCELCGAGIAGPCSHIVEVGVRGVLSACRPCAALFARGDAARFRTVPDRVLADPGFAMTALRWTRLGMPGIAFCYRDSTAIDDAMGYLAPTTPAPTAAAAPAGAPGIADAELAAPVWQAVAAGTQLAAQLASDVEALLVRTHLDARVTCYLVPISSAYDLAARLRRCDRGVSARAEAACVIAGFFAELDRRARR